MGKVVLKNLEAVVTGEAFLTKGGRNIQSGDESLRKGSVDIAIEEGKLDSIGSSSASSEEMDCTGLVATAGFVDSHTHSLFRGNRFKEYFMRWEGRSYQEISAAGGGIHATFRQIEESPDNILLAELENFISQMHQWGTTTMEVKSGYGKTPEGELRLLRLIKKFRDAHPGFNMRSTFLGLHALPKDIKEEKYVASMIELLAQVRSEKLAEFVDAWPEQGFFSLEQSLKFSRAAAEYGMPSKIHADEITDMKATEYYVHQGAASVDHLQCVSREGIELLAQKETVATLLPATSFYLGIDYVEGRKLLESGAQVALATDFNPGTAPDLKMSSTQLLAASQLRMNPAEILCASTYNGAAALNLEKQKGILTPGYDADILLWKCESQNPLEEILLSGMKPHKVILNGQLLSEEN